VGVERIAILSIVVLLTIPWLLRLVEQRVDARDGVTRGLAAPVRASA
jgi:hypothetical protein